MKAILHIGLEKTGSSTIQEFININREILNCHGASVLQTTGGAVCRNLVTYAMTSDSVDDHTVALGIERKPDRALWKSQFEGAINAELRNLNKSIHTIILSSEHFHSRLSSLNEISRVNELLAKSFSEFKIVIYLKRQDKLALSLCSTYFKSGFGGGFSKAKLHMLGLVDDNHYFNYERIITSWTQVFGEDAIVLRIFDESQFHNDDLISDFLFATSLLPLDSKYVAPDRKNISLTSDALIALNSFNSKFIEGQTTFSKEEFDSLRSRLIRKLEKDHAGRPDIFNRTFAELLYLIYKKENDNIAKKWFGRSQLFNEDFSYYPKYTSKALPDENLSKVIENFLSSELI